MSVETKIQWCDSTVNPIMGCGGCELFPTPSKVLQSVDQAVAKTTSEWTPGSAKRIYRDLIDGAYQAIENPCEEHRNTVSTTNIWHFREQFIDQVGDKMGKEAAKAAEAVIAREVTCYAAKLHLNKGFSLLNPDRGTNAGYAPTFEQITHFEGRVDETANLKDLLGTHDPDRSWIDGLPRLIFVSDMGDAFSRKRDFRFLSKEVIKPIASEAGKRHLWLWLTKRPKLMAEFAEELGGFPENICAMTTVTGPDSESLGRIDDLRRVKASTRGLSLEPIWKRVPPKKLDLTGIDWLILGGESGSKVEHSRRFAIEWAEELRDHCRENGVAFFLKQLGRRPTGEEGDFRLDDTHGGNWSEWPDEALRVREFPKAFHEYRKGEVTSGGLRRVRQGDMTPTESKDFKRLHKVVSRFARDTVVASDALFEIRDRKLYRGKFKTFSDYCESVHEMSRQYANRLIKAGKIRAEMVPIVSKMGLSGPENEAQLRQLSRLSSVEDQVEVYCEAIEQAEAGEKKVTARALKDLIELRVEGNTRKDKRQMSPSERLSKARPILDRLEDTLREAGIESEALNELRKLLTG